ncbi:type I-E CRISPR-associated protein Cas6/Cse3/CasE [Sphaerimonospora thailandensis]|uniref:Type I-E CRISPR-associated protein Cas6/Cse3/CasE n=1 Tax=Sphaerimonospora thailandensis TaxID=795644 RepID=A0A8J3VXE0_9ACTN|nr:type I-E CRISPR-associated protein Cas6/Cse3/CasE [Sphaerimonospora thailandensis]GIH68387.1 type I-E CRISPR-associated protein Cas6/Cse3/CasE [Sphaerimonospora thailandensis]
MYLTRLRVNTARVGARQLLSSPQRLHAAVMSSFAEIPVTGDDGPRVLWRVDATSRAETYLYIVGPAKPDLTHLVEQAGWPDTGRWETYDYAPLLDRLSTGDRWSFRLTANPVHTARRRDDEPTKITPHVGLRHQSRWLLQRQEGAGFKVMEKPQQQRLIPEGDEYELVIHNRRQLNFGKGGQQQRVSLVTVTFDGLLEVTDPDAFRRTLTRGLGRAKAYGCGLMTLAAV